MDTFEHLAGMIGSAFMYSENYLGIKITVHIT